MSALTDRIDDAFTRPHYQDAIRLVKDAVHEDLAGLDTNLSIEQTRFFNHTIYPDLVMTWSENGVRNVRSLFLRFEVAEGSVDQDLRLHASDDPIFVGLLDHRPDAQGSEGSSASDELTRKVENEPEPAIEGTLLAEASAIDVLESFAREQAGTSVATGAIARGGYGRLSEARAIELGDGLGIGFAAVREGRDPDLVLTAFDQLEGIVSEQQAGLVATQLQLLWIESGGEFADLFGDERLQLDRLSDAQLRDLLEYLLTRKKVPSPSTLRRIGAAVDADRLGRVVGDFSGGHLSALVEANLDRWTARWVQLRWQEGHGWSLKDELLRFGMGGYQLSFLSRGRKLARSASGDPVARADFTSRIRGDQTIALDMVSRDAEVALRRRSSRDADAQLHAEQIEALGELAGYVLRAEVVSGSLGLPGSGSEVGTEIDYARELCAFDEDVTFNRAGRFMARYFDIPDVESMGTRISSPAPTPKE